MIFLMKPCCAGITLSARFMAVLPFYRVSKASVILYFIIIVDIMIIITNRAPLMYAALDKAQEVRFLSQGTYNQNVAKERWEMEAEKKQGKCIHYTICLKQICNDTNKPHSRHLKIMENFRHFQIFVSTQAKNSQEEKHHSQTQGL